MYCSYVLGGHLSYRKIAHDWLIQNKVGRCAFIKGIAVIRGYIVNVQELFSTARGFRDRLNGRLVLHKISFESRPLMA